MNSVIRQILKSRRLIIAILLLLILTAVFGLGRLRVGVDPAAWVDSPEDSLRARSLHDGQFGDPEMVGILVEAGDVLSRDVLTELQDMTARLKSEVPHLRGVVSVVDPSFRESSLESLLRDYDESTAEVIDVEWIENLEKLMRYPGHPISHLVSADRGSTVIYLTFNPVSGDRSGPDRLESLYRIGESVQSVLADFRTAEFEISASGIPIVSYEQPRYFGLISAILLIAAFLMVSVAVGIVTRSFRVTLTVLSGAILPILFVFSGYAYAGVLIEATLVTVPCLLGFSLGVGYAVHVHHRLQIIAAGSTVNGRHLCEALGDSSMPVLFAGLTTAAAMLSFNVLALRPIRWTGSCSALIVLVTVGTSLLLPLLVYPGCRLPPPRRRPAFPSDRLARFVDAHRQTIIIATLAACIICTVLAVRIRIGGDSNDLMGPRVPYVRAMNRVVESGTGSSYTFNVLVVPSENSNGKTDAWLLDTAASVERSLLNEGFGKRVHSIFDVLRPVQGIRDGLYDSGGSLPAGEISPGSLTFIRRLHPALLKDWINPETDIMRFVVEVDGYDPVQLSRKLDRLKAALNDLSGTASVLVIGQIVDFAFMQSRLIRDQFRSLILSLLVIYFLLSLVFRSPLLGAVGMLPNIVPVVLVAGLMGAFRFSLDSVSLTIMPMVLGISVDDTVHFIHHYRIARNRYPPQESILQTYRIAGRGIVLTTLFLVAGFSAYLAGPPRFMLVMGLLVIFGLLTALAADLLLLPAIFSSKSADPVGKGRRSGRVPH